MEKSFAFIIATFFITLNPNFLFSDDSKPKEPVLVRWMIRRDLPKVLEIEENSFEHPWSENEFLQTLKERDIMGVVAENREGKVVGFAVYKVDHNKIKLLNIAVAPENRRNQVGSQIIDRLTSKLGKSQKEVDLVVTEQNLDAQLFFKKKGFMGAKILKEYFEEGSSGIRFSYRVHEGALEGPIPETPLSDEEFTRLWDQLIPVSVRAETTEVKPISPSKVIAQEEVPRSKTLTSQSDTHNTQERADSYKKLLNEILTTKYRKGRKFALIASTALQWAVLYGWGNGLGAEVTPAGFVTSGILAGLASRYLTQQLSEVWESSILNGSTPKNRYEEYKKINSTAKLALKTGTVQGLCLVTLQRLVVGAFQ